MERSLKAQHRSCFVVLPSATRVEQIHLRHVFISGETTEDFERSDTKTAQKGKKRFDRRAGEEDGTVLTERGRGRSISPTPCFWTRGTAPALPAAGVVVFLANQNPVLVPGLARVV